MDKKVFEKTWDEMDDYERRAMQAAVNQTEKMWHVKWWIVRVGITLVLLIALMMAGCPPYLVWEQGLTGQAELKRAEQNRQILVEQARAEKEASKFRAEAIEIVGQAAKDFPEYRYQEFLGAFGEALTHGNVEKIVFIPTEANIPITEAGRTTQ